jgi:hypothetical protein
MSQPARSSQKEYICPMCRKPIDLNKDETADEDGQVMHAECYFKRIGGHGNDPPDPHHVS